ncbi:MAG: RNA methyltransferase [Bacteroidetes Order II. Incertae sedis bacterium]|nr:RNA methyltransferase [Bacteroidetes Order II. bacterium]
MMTIFPPASKSLIKQIIALQQKKFRKRDGLFVVEGMRSVQSALAIEKDELAFLLISEGTTPTPKLLTACRRKSVEVYIAHASDFAKCSDVVQAQGVLAVAKIPKTLPETLPKYRRILALNGIQDPGNVGTLIRTAAWFGIEAIVADGATADFFQPKVVRATMGGLWDVQLFQVPSLIEALTPLKRQGFRLYAADLAGTPIEAWQPQTPSVLIAGSEAHGLATEVRTICNEMVYISGAGNSGVESLNVAVATSILAARWAITPMASPFP